MKIRAVRSGEVQALRDIAWQTFADTYAQHNTRENIELYCKKNFTLENTLSELDADGSQFCFLEVSGEIVGYLKLNTGSAQTDDKLTNALEIERIYICKSGLGQGYGQALFAHALEKALAGSFTWLWLGVWENNPRAIAFYEKNDFIRFATHPFLLGTERQADILMRRRL